MPLGNASRTNTADDLGALARFDDTAQVGALESWRATRIADIRHFEFRHHAEKTGTLVPITGDVDVPFQIARVFTVVASEEGAARGSHALQHCRQVLVCLTGACTVTCNDGTDTRLAVLDSPEHGLYLPPAIWRKLTYSSGATLMVLCDRPYRPEEYFNDYQEFIRLKTAA